jgi:flagellar biosynthesis/type III secretory pathway M-ring protein FliF/YscJ
MTFLDFIKTPAFVLAVLFVIALIYTIYAKIRDGKAEKAAAAAAAPAEEKKQTPAAAPVAAAEGISSGELDLVDTDEKTAAVIMALVSYKSGIPLNRLSFKSIRLMEDK